MLDILVALALAAAPAQAGGRPPVLRVYGPGGPLAPMLECGKLFARARGVAVRVDGGPEQRWWEIAERDADVIFESAEYMLSDFMRRHPGFLDPSTRTSLFDRPAAILVRKGNPKAVRRLEDLARPGMRLLDVVGAGQLGLWEDLAGRKGLIPSIARNIAASFANTQQAVSAWRADPTLDAWIAFESWHHSLPAETDVVRLPEEDRLLRGTPAAVAQRSEQRRLALDFLAWVRGEECHAVFRRAGWR
jgi:accessory colonization factor AcfC